MTTDVPQYLADPEAAEAARDLKMALAQSYLSEVMSWLQGSADLPAEWQEAADFGNNVLYLTAAELRALRADVQRLLAPYVGRYAEPDERPEGSRRVTFLRFSFPSPSQPTTPR
jgi:hypothetical protein